MTAADHLAELLDQRVELRAGNVVVTRVDEARVDAELAQERDRAQDREPVAIEVVEQAEDLLPLALQPSVVELAVTWMEIDLEGLLLLRRQVAATSSFVRRLMRGLILRRSRASRSPSPSRSIGRAYCSANRLGPGRAPAP